MNKVLLITGLSIIAILGIIVADATLNPPTSWSRGTKTYLNYTDMQNETGLRNGSISNITWIGFTPEKVNGTLQPCPLSAENNATLCYNQTTNNLTVSYNGSIRYRILDNRTSVTGTEMTVMKPSMGDSTVYQNTNTTVRQISVSLQYIGGPAPNITVWTGVNNPPTTPILNIAVTGGTIPIYYSVMPNHYYMMNYTTNNYGIADATWWN